LKSIFKSAGLDGDEYTIPKNAGDIKITGFLGYLSHRDALVQTVFGAWAEDEEKDQVWYLDDSRSDKIQIKHFNHKYAGDIPRTRVFQNNFKVEKLEIPGSYELEVHDLSEGEFSWDRNVATKYLDSGESQLLILRIDLRQEIPIYFRYDVNSQAKHLAEVTTSDFYRFTVKNISPKKVWLDGFGIPAIDSRLQKAHN
jgi:hypothetical protein